MASHASNTEPMGQTPTNDQVRPPTSMNSMGMLMFGWALQALGSMSLNAIPPSAQDSSNDQNHALPPLINLPQPAATQNPDPAAEIPDSEDDDSEDDYSYRSSDWDSDGNTVDESEKAFERKNRLFEADDDGELRWKQHESSYTDAEIRRRGEYSATCMYDTASPKELRKYVRDRRLPDPYPQGLTLKYLYIIALDQADRDKSFRFLDLPAEMRNLIYTILLTFGHCTHCPRVHQPCHTGILQASKQVYKEARNILYGENEIRCSVGASGYNDEEPENFFSLIHIHETREKSDSLDRVFLGMSQIPEWFRRIQCLRIDLEFTSGSVAAAGFKLQTCLLNLASFLMDEHCLKKLKVTITDSSDDEDGDGLDGFGDIIAARLDTLIYPLRRLRGIEHVEITGVSKVLAESTVAEMQKPSGPVFNTLQHFNNLREEAKGYRQLLLSVNPYNFSGNFVPPGHGEHFSDDLELLIAELGEYDEMDETYNPFADAETEANTRRKMEDLKGCLAKVQFTDFELRKREFLALRKARTAYQMKAKWEYVDGKKKKSDAGLRHDWEHRIDPGDYF